MDILNRSSSTDGGSPVFLKNIFSTQEFLPTSDLSFSSASTIFFKPIASCHRVKIKGSLSYILCISFSLFLVSSLAQLAMPRWYWCPTPEREQNEPPCFSIPLLGKSQFQEVRVFGHPELMGQVTLLHSPPEWALSFTGRSQWRKEQVNPRATQQGQDGNFKTSLFTAGSQLRSTLSYESFVLNNY